MSKAIFMKVDNSLIRLLFISLCTLGSALKSQYAQAGDSQNESLEKQRDLNSWPSSDDLNDSFEANDTFLSLIEENLSLNQKEILQEKIGDLKLHLGPVFPWQDLGFGTSWKKANREFWGLGFGRGKFTLQQEIKGLDYKTSAQIESFYASYWYYFERLPFVITVFTGLNTWSGDIRPMGFDFSDESSAASLNSDFSNISLSLGFKASFYWQWKNNLALEASVFDLSSGFYLKEAYTTNISSARNSLRKTLRGPNLFAGLQFSLVYWFSESPIKNEWTSLANRFPKNH